MAARVRLIVAWGLFVAWIAWLGWQSARYGRFDVVSRAQLANADLAVVAKITADADGRALSKVHIERVIWPQPNAADLAGQDIEILKLPSCEGFQGAGDYVLPLSRGPKGDYALAVPARSPLIDPARHRPTIYPATGIVIDQIAGMAHRAAAP